jgi:conjugative transfer signal peptidase TraF
MCSERQTPRLVWNATASAPIGLYLVKSAQKIHHGDLVLAVPPRAVQRFAAGRGYLPIGVPLVKHVAALAHDHVCGVGNAITINDRFATRRSATDHLHRILPAWTGCRTLTPSEVLLLNAEAPRSFDGRYFGPLSTTTILGKLVPLWTR